MRKEQKLEIQNICEVKKNPQNFALNCKMSSSRLNPRYLFQIQSKMLKNKNPNVFLEEDRRNPKIEVFFPQNTNLQ